jgi:uncharacterized membrane protein
MHIFGITVWLGGLMFQGAVITPVIQHETQQTQSVFRILSKRFTGFIWMSVWTIFITGLLMMLLNPKFVWFQYHDRWSMLLLWKQIIFVVMIFYAFGYARMLQYLDLPSSNGGYDEKVGLYRQRLHQFRTISIILGILALFLSAAMRIYG